MDYAWEKFMVAVHGMAASPKPLQMRIADAYCDSLVRLTGHEAQHLPKDLHGPFADVVSALDTHPAVGDEGTAMASARAMNEGEAMRVAGLIVQIYDELCSRR